MAFGEKFAQGFSQEFGPTYRQSGSQFLQSQENQRDRSFRASENEKDRRERRDLYGMRYGQDSGRAQEARDLQLVQGFFAELQNPESPLRRDDTLRYGTLIEIARATQSPRAHALLGKFRDFDEEIRFSGAKEGVSQAYSERLALLPDQGRGFEAEMQMLQGAQDPQSLRMAQGALQRRMEASVAMNKAAQRKQNAMAKLQAMGQIPGISEGTRGALESVLYDLEGGLVEPERVSQAIDQALQLAFGSQGDKALMEGFEPPGQGPEGPWAERAAASMQERGFQRAPVERAFTDLPDAARRRLQRVVQRAFAEGGDEAALEALIESGVRLDDLPEEFFALVRGDA
jgi:hypothetical protein